MSLSLVRGREARQVGVNQCFLIRKGEQQHRFSAPLSASFFYLSCSFSVSMSAMVQPKNAGDKMDWRVNGGCMCACTHHTCIAVWQYKMISRDNFKFYYEL